MMRTWRTLRLFGALPILLLFLGVGAPTHAQQAVYRSDNQAREAAEQAVRRADSGFSSERLRTWRREDLEGFLLTVEQGKPIGNLYFYEMQAPPRTAFDPYSVWVVAVASSTREVYELYGFEASIGFNGSLLEFNRLVAQLSLSIPKEKATSFASFFLGSCAGGKLPEVVLDEHGLQHAVQRYYFETYGAVWRALEAYLQWWQGLQTNPLDLSPTVRFENGRYRVVLKRILLSAGRHPQLQEWDLEIAPDGNVRVLAMQPIFPKQPRWLFLDSP